MRLISFEDRCVIKRDLGVKDEYDNPLKEEIYSGQCRYQEGSHSNSQQIFVRNPILFLPDVSAKVCVNDNVEITTSFGSHFTAVVSLPRELIMPINRERVIRLELKHAME